MPWSPFASLPSVRPSWSGVGIMAAPLPAVVPLPGVLAGSVLVLILVLVLGSNSAHGENFTTSIPSTSTASPSGPNIAAIVAPTVILGLLAVASAVLGWLFCVVRKKRQTEGTYRPSAEEQSGTRGVEAPDTLKLPKEERLI